MQLSRYESRTYSSSNLDHFDDMVDTLGYLLAPEYVVELLTKTHGYGVREAKARAKRIVSHARIGISYLEQTKSSPSEVSFLSAYYAILNLAKVCILFGPYADELRGQSRWHGASYPTNAKDSRSLLTEKFIFNPGGALALYYKTLVGINLPSKRTIVVGDLYRCISDISVEFDLATGGQSAVYSVDFNYTSDNTKGLIFARLYSPNPINVKVSQLPALNGFKKNGENEFIKILGPPATNSEDINGQVRAAVDVRFLYSVNQSISRMSGKCSSLKMTEEMPIALAFFHLSSVCRYKPEFLDKVVGSKYWPIVRSFRRHGLFRFMTLVWSFVQRKELCLKSI